MTLVWHHEGLGIVLFCHYVDLKAAFNTLSITSNYKESFVIYIGFGAASYLTAVFLYLRLMTILQKS